GSQHRHRRPPERREVDPLQRADAQRRPGGELPVRHHRAQRRR
ncbi:MAG: GTP-binding and nucleic acid-binding protein YchF, partial [uncultured Friedmanniella sp.]